MQRIKCRILVLIFLSLFFTAPLTFSQNKLKTIVVFFSMNYNAGAYNFIIEAIRGELIKEAALKYNMTVEFLDVGRMPNDDYARNIVSLYNEKFAETPIDLIIVIGPAGLKALNTFGLKALEKLRLYPLRMKV